MYIDLINYSHEIIDKCAIYIPSDIKLTYRNYFLQLLQELYLPAAQKSPPLILLIYVYSANA